MATPPATRLNFPQPALLVSGYEGAVAKELPVSNPEKVLYPASGFTKAEVVDYYRRIAPVLVPHLRGRALTLRRFPDGVEGGSFFEKRCPSHAPQWVHTVEVTRSSGPAYRACAVEDTETLLWLANLAALELHPSLAVADDPERPTVMVFDLDPGAPAGMSECAEVACSLRRLLGDLDLDCVAKTSGSKGMQVYVPLEGPVDFDTTKLLSHTIGLMLEKQLHPLVVTTMAKGDRPGKVFIDWSQNDRAKTTVCVYSLRAMQRPAVSTPLRWAEVEKATSDGANSLAFSPQDVLSRVDDHGDLFSLVLELRQQLPEQVRSLLSGPS